MSVRSTDADEIRRQRSSDVVRHSEQILNLVAISDESETFHASSRSSIPLVATSIQGSNLDELCHRKTSATNEGDDKAIKEFEKSTRNGTRDALQENELPKISDDEDKTTPKQVDAEYLQTRTNLIESLVVGADEIQTCLGFDHDTAKVEGKIQKMDAKQIDKVSGAQHSDCHAANDQSKTQIQNEYAILNGQENSSRQSAQGSALSGEDWSPSRNDVVRLSPSGPRHDKMTGQTAPPALTRDGSVLPAPGAMRIAGMLSQEDSLEDSAMFSVTDQSNYPAESAAASEVAEKLDSSDPVQAILVADHDTEREQELAEREKHIRERELALEKKLREMEKPTVKAQVVEPNKSEKKKKKTFLGFFKRSSPKRERAEKQASAPIHADNIVAKKSLSSVSSHSDASSVSGSFSSLAHRLDQGVFGTVPIFKSEEIIVGKQFEKSKITVMHLLQTIKLDERWTPTIDTEAAESDTAIKAQVELRQNAVAIFSSKTQPFRRYAVKRIRGSLDGRRRDVAAMQLAYEATLLLKLSHENIVKLKGISENIVSAGTPSDQSFFTITEKMEDNLFERLTKTWSRKIKGPEFFLDRLNVATSLASALSYLHSLNIIYFDLKPENVGFDKSGTLVLHNFSAGYELKGCTTPYDAAAFTASPFMGTHPYVAPEVVLAQRAGLKSDVYGFSIILWEILTLKEPYEGIMIHEYTKKVIKEQKRPKLGKKIPVELNATLSAGWQHDPSQRPCMKTVYETLLCFQDDYVTSVNKK